MPDNIIDSYFVKVAALPDAASFLKLHRTLKSTNGMIDNFAANTAKNLLTIETAALGTIAALGIGMISIADKTAMADQSYRLFGLRMLMDKQSARAMQMALDQLGATIDQVAYDPELNQRFQFLYEQNIKLGTMLGQNFDKNMKGIRDIRMEYKRFSTEFEFLIMGSVSKLFDKLGYSDGSLLTFFKNLNTEFISNIPYYADSISTHLVPAWKDFLTVSSDVIRVTKEIALDYTNMVGEFSGDRSIISSTLTFENFAKALEHTANGITTVATVGTKFFSAENKSWGYLYHLAEEDTYKRMAQNEYDSAAKQPPGSDIRPFISKAHEYMGLSQKEHELALDLENEIKMGEPDNPNIVGREALDKITNQQKTEKGHKFRFAKNFDELTVTVGKEAFNKYLDEATKTYPDVDKYYLASLIWDESHGDPKAVGPLLANGQRAKGLAQFLPGTANDMGISDVFDPEQSIVGAAKYLHNLTKQYGDLPTVLAYYGGYKGNVDKAHDYINDIMSQRNAFLPSAGLHIEHFTVNLPPGTPAEQALQLKKEMEKIMDDINIFVTAQVAAGPYH